VRLTHNLVHEKYPALRGEMSVRSREDWPAPTRTTVQYSARDLRRLLLQPQDKLFARVQVYGHTAFVMFAKEKDVNNAVWQQKLRKLLLDPDDPRRRSFPQGAHRVRKWLAAKQKRETAAENDASTESESHKDTGSESEVEESSASEQEHAPAQEVKEGPPANHVAHSSSLCRCS